MKRPESMTIEMLNIDRVVDRQGDRVASVSRRAKRAVVDFRQLDDKRLSFLSVYSGRDKISQLNKSVPFHLFPQPPMDKSIFSRPVICTADIDYNTASWEQLRLWFRYHLGKTTSLHELRDGDVYCQLLSDLYPQAVDTGEVLLCPINRGQRLANWHRLEAAFKMLDIKKELDIPERIRLFSLDNLDFARWFVAFYEDRKNCPIYFIYE